MKFKVIPPYRHVTQKKNLCLATCLKMVLIRREFEANPEKIASAIGIRVNEVDKDCYSHDLHFLPEGDKNLGFKLKEFENKSTKEFLANYNLKAETFPLSKVENMEKFLEENIEKNNDIILNFYWKPINAWEFGHYVMLVDFDTETNKVGVCDPHDLSDDYWKIHLDSLKDSMLGKWDGFERGFVVISEI